MAKDLIRLRNALFLPACATVREVSWHPAADVYRTRNGWLLKFDLAGVRPEDIQLEVNGPRLTVRGTRRDWCAEEGCHHYSLEIAYSHFERCVDLPACLDQARITTEQRDGMLLVRIELEAVA